MDDIRQQLRAILGRPGRVAVVGVGNVESGDDGFGVCLVRRIAAWLAHRNRLAESGSGSVQTGCEIIEAGLEPERYSRQLVDGGFDRVLFVDAVGCERTPGTVVLADSKQLSEIQGQASTHRVGLGLLAKYIEQVGGARVWILGVKPETVRRGRRLSGPVAESLDLLELLMREALEVARC